MTWNGSIAVGRIEEQQRDLGGGFREEREIHAIGIRRDPKRVGRSGLDVKDRRDGSFDGLPPIP